MQDRKLLLRTLAATALAFAGVAQSARGDAAPAPGSTIHGFMGMQLKTDYITPRGLWVHDDGAALQVVNGLVFVTSPDTSIVVGMWNDINLWSRHLPQVDAWNEFDWFIGVNHNVGKWAFGLQYVEFLSPPNIFETEKNAELSVSYDDSTPGGTFAFKPYVKFFYAISGDSTVVLGDTGDTFDVEIGVTPTWSLGRATLTVPTWVTVGPESYWGGDNGNVGVFSTGVAVKYPLGIPQQFGKWYVEAGVMVIHTREGHLPDLSDAPIAKIERGHPSRRIGDVGPMGRILIRGEPGHDIIPELYPAPGEIVIDKPGKGAFYATALGDVLVDAGIDTLLVCGVTTEVCVHTTVREGNDRGYRCVVLSDCCASYFPEFHYAGLRMVRAGRHIRLGFFIATTGGRAYGHLISTRQAPGEEAS